MEHFEIVSLNWKFVYGSIIGTGFGIFIWEHIARKRKMNKKPSVFINCFAKHLGTFFKFCGIWTAKLSSIYTLINPKEIYITLEDLWKPIWDCVKSLGEFAKGYKKIAWDYGYPIVYVMGSMTLISVLGFIGYLSFTGKIPIRDLLFRLLTTMSSLIKKK